MEMAAAAAAELLGDDMDEWLWPESCGELRQIESSLRCLICGDFYHGPVVLPCSHTFCSECVRRFLQSRGASGCCPECKQPCVPGDLVANRSLEKIGVLFQQMKPKVLPLLTGTKAKRLASQNGGEGIASSKRNEGGAGDGKPAERMPLLSYNVMKDKDIKKLLETINIRASIKNKEDIIQIHKEYVLLANAQADSSHPKSAKQIRDEVMRNYRARQQEKQFGLGGSGTNNRKSLEAAPGAPVSAEMQAGFQRLIQQVKNRGMQQKAQASEEQDGDDEEEDGDDDEEEQVHGDAEGVWRHVHALKTNQEFYIHSVTNEIRLQPPQEFLDHQKRLKEQRDKAENEVVVVEDQPAQPASNAEVTTIAIDEDDDFEIITSPPPKPPLGSRQSTPQSVSSSAAKKGKRRTSISSTASSGIGATRLFSQESSSASFQETATQMAPSSSLSFPASNAAADDEDAMSPTQPSAESRWECPRCTLVNEGPGLAECEACGHQHRPARKKQKMQFQRKIFSSLSQDLR